MKRIITVSVLLCLAGCNHRPVVAASSGKDGEMIYKSGTAPRSELQLPDGSKVLMNAASTIRLPRGFSSSHRELFLDGEALFNVNARQAGAFVVHTRALVTRVNSTVAVFKVEGFRNQPGEEVELLSGGLTVNRSYHSDTDNAPEMLEAGEMLMINTDIDLMEKEKFDSSELKSWMARDESSK